MTLFSESLETFQEAWTGDEGNYRIAEMSAGIIRFGVAPPRDTTTKISNSLSDLPMR